MHYIINHAKLKNKTSCIINLGSIDHVTSSHSFFFSYTSINITMVKLRNDA